MLIAALTIGLAVLPVEAAEPAKATVTVDVASDGMLHVTTVVVDALGAPVAGTTVAVKARTTFGWLAVGQRSTDAAGRAQVDLPPTVRPREISVEAGEDGQVRAAFRLGQRARTDPLARPGRALLGALSPQPGLISPYPIPIQVGLLAVVLGGIWTAYAYIVWLLSRIRNAR